MKLEAGVLDEWLRVSWRAAARKKMDVKLSALAKEERYPGDPRSIVLANKFYLQHKATAFSRMLNDWLAGAKERRNLMPVTFGVQADVLENAEEDQESSALQLAFLRAKVKISLK